MTDATMSDVHAPAGRSELKTSDGRSLKEALRKSETINRRRALFLVLPLLLLLAVSFIIPIGQLATRSVYNPEVANYLPETSSALSGWNGEELPEEEVFAALAADMAKGMEDRTIGRVAARINREIPGSRSMFMGQSRSMDDLQPPYREAFLDADEGWGNLSMWRFLKRETRLITPAYYLLALDLEYNTDGEIVQRPPEYQVYRGLFLRTIWMSCAITGLCILLGYPIAHLLATQPLRTANLLMILVLLPFWTSLLVRTSSWIVLLQQQGVLNDMMVSMGLISDGNRIRMIYNQAGTIIAMTHILLPFMILPLYSVMKTIPPSYMRAARSLGATQSYAFRKVYMPLTIPGMAAGVLLVFILAIGYYITPALVGGDSGIFISNLIAANMQSSLANLKLGAALATILLVLVLIFYLVFNKLVGVDRLKFG